MQSKNSAIDFFDNNTQMALQFLEKQKRAEQTNETVEPVNSSGNPEINADLYRFTTELALQFIQKVRYGTEGEV